MEKELSGLCKSIGESAWATKYRLSSLERMEAMPLPSFRYSASINLVPDFNFKKVCLTKPARFDLKVRSAEGMDVIHVKNYSLLGQKTLSLFSSIKQESWMSLFNQSFATDLIFIKVPKKNKLKSPASIELVFYSVPAAVQILVLAEEKSDATIIFKSRNAEDWKSRAETAVESGSRLVSMSVHVLAKESSRIELVSIQDLSEDVFCIEERSSRVMKGASMDWVDLSTGAGYNYNSTVSELAEDGAATKTRFLFTGNRKQVKNIFTSAVHKSHHTYSDLLTRGVVGDEARVLSRGLIDIESNAYGSKGYEKQDALLLSQSAEADAIPNLEIKNNDVKCSHGSAVGQIDFEKMFYLMSRGLSENEARGMIIKGYFNQVLEKFEGSEREEIERELYKKI